MTPEAKAELRGAFESVNEWVFDLDNTLYPRDSDLFAQIDWKMTAFVEKLTGLAQTEARALQKRMYREHGTTLRGLMVEYDIDPHDFLADVHDIDYSPVEPNPALGALINALPGRALIFTNGDVPHAQRTIERLGIADHFDEIFDIVAADLEPKPAEGPYRKFLDAHSVDPNRAAMFEDMPRNLDVPKRLGMATVLVLPAVGSVHEAEAWEHDVSDGHIVDFTTHHLDTFLADLLEALNS
ncbi:MAG: pyrimidine 5'-nucleotidase [Pseudomonadota bacterium]